MSTKVVSHPGASTVHTATMRFGMHLPHSAPQTHVELCGTNGSHAVRSSEEIKKVVKNRHLHPLLSGSEAGATRAGPEFNTPYCLFCHCPLPTAHCPLLTAYLRTADRSGKLGKVESLMSKRQEAKWSKAQYIVAYSETQARFRPISRSNILRTSRSEPWGEPYR